MKVALNTLQPVGREHARHAAARANAAASPTALSGVPPSADAADRAADAAKPAKLADMGGQKDTPPGLERVLARLESIPLPERTAGQSRALQQVARNIARYVENQAMSTPPADAPPPNAPPPGATPPGTPPAAAPESAPAPAADIVV